jgi:inosine-uridine nucleoside N-ribohydrolase
MKQIIIDTDPGVDDALAILLAISSKLNIVGITTTYGNSTIENTTKNTLSILQILNSNIPVYQGSALPLIKKPILAKSHGQNGLGGFSLKNLQRKKEDITAIQFLINSLEKSKDKEIDILCLGPTTNLAILEIIRPDLITKINQIIILGGVFFEKGNITPKAEFNVYNDPQALDIVLSFEANIILIPINICRQVTFTLDELNQIDNLDIGNSIKKIAKAYINYYQYDKKYGGFSGGVMYDILAIAYLIKPSLFKTEEKFISVSLAGQTKIKNMTINNCNLVTKAKPEQIKKLFFDSVNNQI